MTEPKWMQDETLQGIDKKKLEFLQGLVFESRNLSQKELLRFAMSLAQRKNSVSFSKEEMELIIAAIKKHSAPKDVEKINRIIRMRETQGY